MFALMDDLAAVLIEALDRLKVVAGELTADEAADELDQATLQVFWREWPSLSGWSGALWRQINADLEAPATAPQGKEEVDELGGSG